MKRLLIFAMLIASSYLAQAQAGSLTATNHNTQCGVYFVMYSTAATEGDGTACDMVGYGFYLCPSGTCGSSSVTWTTPGSYNASPGFMSETTMIPPGIFSTISDFVWTDVYYQWRCQEPCAGTGGWGAMSEVLLGPTATCLGYGYSFSGSSSCTGTCTWTSSTAGSVMSNVTLDFY